MAGAGEQVTWGPVGIRTVYGVILNDRDTLERLGGALSAPPYVNPPVAPVIYIKPANTFARDGDDVSLPPGVDTVEIYGTLGILFGRAACHVPPEAALECVRGFTVVADLTLPHDSLYRPPIREKCFDRSCVIGSKIADKVAVGEVSALEVQVSVNGMVMQRWSLQRLVRPVPKLIADISAFMTLDAGDILLAGIVANAPPARRGDLIAVEIPGIGRIENRIGGAIP